MKRERIVVIDDNPNDAELVRRFIERAGYEVGYAASGDEGLALIRETFPDCVMVDYRMPGIDGYEVCRRLKADPTLRAIPVLMLTGADAAKNVVEGLEAGADDFVTKSSDIEVILARIRALLRVKAYQDRIVEQAEQLRKLYEEVKEKSDRIMALNQRLNSDLQFARRVQEALLPQREFVAANALVQSEYIPSETLSGDFYDYFIAQDRLYLFMADVSGHGLAAAILVSLLKSYIHSEVTESESLASFMTQLNDFLFTASLPSQFATAQLFKFDPVSHRMTFANAAHPPFLVWDSATRKTELHDHPGHLLGALPSMAFEEFDLTMNPGSILFCYTDGLTDRRNEAGEFYSPERVAAVIEKHAEAAWLDLCREIRSDITAFTPRDDFKDDIAFIVARFGA